MLKTAFSKPGSATKSYVNIFLIFTCLLDSTKPAALDDILIGTPLSTNADAILPDGVSKRRTLPIICLLVLSYSTFP